MKGVKDRKKKTRNGYVINFASVVAGRATTWVTVGYTPSNLEKTQAEKSLLELDSANFQKSSFD